jgi:signal transduction histidine kinase
MATGLGLDNHSIIADALDLVSEGFVLFDQHDRLVFCNQTYRAFYSLITDMLVPGTPFEAIVRASIERGQFSPNMGDLDSFVTNRLRLHAHDYIVHEHELHDGRWLRVTERRMPNGWVFGSRTDITELKKREMSLAATQQELIDAIEALQEGFALFDANDQLVICNDKYRRLFPLIDELIRPGARFEELIRVAAYRGQNVEALDDAERWVEERLTAHSRASGTFEHQFSDGRYVWVSERKTGDGRTLSTYVDITQLKRREEELENNVTVIERANRAKSEFLARMSHELRTPLNAIIGFSDTMRQGLLGRIENERYRGYVDDIFASGNYLLSLVNDLLDISKIEAAQLELSEQQVEIAPLVELCFRIIRQRADAKGVELQANLPSESPRLLGDEIALRKILINILSNAVKFTPAGGSVSLTCRVTPNGETVVEVRDTGIGISTENLPRVTEPFVQVAPGADRAGTGLGLAITKSLVEMHNGTLEIASELGKGTVVTARFAEHRTVADPPATPSRDSAQAPSGTSRA